MAFSKSPNVVAVAAALCGMAGVAACVVPSAHANAPESDPKRVVDVRIESASQLVGIKGTTPLRVIGVLAGGGTRVLRPGEVKLHITPPRAGRILANHTLYPRMKGDLLVHATIGTLKSKPVRFEAIPF